MADRITTDLHGNVIAVKNPDAKLRLMFAGHCDQIGMLIQHIDAEGFLYAQTIGGWDPQVLIGQPMTVWTADGPVPAIIARKPIHLLTDEERKQVVKLKDLWIDIGAKTKRTRPRSSASVIRSRCSSACTRCATICASRHGDGRQVRPVDRGRGLSPGHAAQAGRRPLLRLDRAGRDRPARCQTASFGIDPQIGIAVDVTHATDCPTVDKKQEGDVRLGGGPVIYRGPNMNPHVVDRLVQVADKGRRPVPNGRQRPRPPAPTPTSCKSAAPAWPPAW